MRVLLIIIFQFIFCTCVFAQQYELMGVLKFNTTSMISYRLLFTEENGKVVGYSITDLQGENETKNRIEGNYDKKSKIFSFSEKEIEYTKSKVTQADFCYVHFSGKLVLSDKSTLKGKFKGLFKNNATCVNGSLHLVAAAKMSQKIAKTTKKLQKSKRVNTADKEKLDLNRVLDSLKTNLLRSNDITSVYLNSNEVELELWDAGQEDGDKVTVYVNDKILLNNYEIKREKKIIKLSLLTGESVIKIVALNTGTIAPNTAMISIRSNDKTIKLQSHLDKNNFTVVKVVRKNQND